MRRLVLGLLVLGAIAFAPSAPAAGPYSTLEETYVVPTRHGDLYMEVARPVDAGGNAVKAPAVLTMSPYSVLGRNGGASHYEYAYSSGIRYFDNNENPGDEGFDTPAAFDFGLALPPPVDNSDATWGDRVLSTITPCDELAHTEHGYDDTPDYDAFWLERDYITRASNIRIPVLVAYNWGDWNVKQEESVNLYRALTRSPVKKLYAGTRWSGHGTPGGDYGKTVDAWSDHWLLGVKNGIEKMPDVHSEVSDYSAPVRWYSGKWPATTAVTLYPQFEDGGDYQWRLLPYRPHPAAGAPQATFTPTGRTPRRARTPTRAPATAGSGSSHRRSRATCASSARRRSA